MRPAIFAALLMSFCVSFLDAQSTIYWSKDHVYAGADGKEIAIVTPPTTDTTVPTTPSSLASSSLTPTSVHLSWTGSTDSGGSGLAGYKVYRQMGSGASLPVGTVGAGTTSFTDQPLQPSTSYTYVIRAFDNAQNHSSASGGVTITTISSSGDTTAPSMPINVQATSPTSTSMVVTWAPSTDAGGSGLAGYKVKRNGTIVSGGSLLTSASFTDSGLTANTSYSYNVFASDGVGNLSSDSTTLAATTIRTLVFKEDFNHPDTQPISWCTFVYGGTTVGCWQSMPWWHILGQRATFSRSIGTGWWDGLAWLYLTSSFKVTLDIVNNPNKAGINFWNDYTATIPGYYRAYVMGTTLKLSFFDYSTETVLSTGTVPASTGTISVVASMSTKVAQVFFNGVSILSYTETNTSRPNHGWVGMAAYNTTGATSDVFLDNFILEY